MIELIYDDCLRAMDMLIKRGVKPDAIISDIPFGITKCKWDNIIPFNEMWERIELLRKPNTAVVLFGKEPFSSMLRVSNIKNFKYDWIIEKTSATGFLNSKIMPMSAHEKVHVFYKNNYYPQKTTGHKRKIKSVNHNRNCVKTENYNKHGLTSYDSTERFPRSVLNFKWDKQKSSLHPTQKPLKLGEYLIKTYSKKDDFILDFTMGAGFIPRASNKLNRNCIGIDNGKCTREESEYFDMTWKDVVEDLIKKDNTIRGGVTSRTIIKNTSVNSLYSKIEKIDD